ncbi:hypothetical protein AOLI_G00056270 [Acnodon oligacanthus]
MEMKTSRVCLALGLVLLMTVSSDAAPFAPAHPELCCFNFATSEIPDAEITGVVKTHPNCPKSGYVFTTPNGRICKKDLK